MIGIILVTHGRLADEFKSALEHITGPQEQLATICIEADDDVDRRRHDIITAIKEMDQGQGIVLLTDMFGGTPSNLAISVMHKGKVEVIAGMNLPMLVALATKRHNLELPALVTEAQEAGRKYINVASALLRA